MKELVYIDSNIFVSHYRRSEKLQHKKSKLFIDFITNPENIFKNIEFLISKFALLEIVGAIKRTTNNTNSAQSIAWKIERNWRDKIGRIEPSSRKDWENFIDGLIETAIEFKTTAADTIHAQILKEYDIKYFVTFNKRHFSLVKRKYNFKIVDPLEMMEHLTKNSDKYVR